MQIAQIEENKYQVFSVITAVRERNACINAVKYIKTLATMSNTNIMHWDITGLFGKPGGKIATDRTEINKIFFHYRENAPANPTSIDAASYAKILELNKKRLTYSCENLKTQAKNKLDSAEKYYTDYYLRYMKESAGLLRRYQAMQGYVPNYALEIEQVCAAGFWKFVLVDDNGVLMETANDIILVHIDPSHGVKRSVNLGRFSANYNCVIGTVYARGVGNNVEHAGYIHPHISNRTICFGELQNASHDYIASGNLTKTFEIIQKAITSYNDDSAYRALHQFEQARQDMTSGRAPVESEDESDDEDEDPELAYTQETVLPVVGWDVAAQPANVIYHPDYPTNERIANLPDGDRYTLRDPVAGTLTEWRRVGAAIEVTTMDDFGVNAVIRQDRLIRIPVAPQPTQTTPYRRTRTNADTSVF